MSEGESEPSECERKKKNKALTVFFHNGKQLSHPSSAVTVCRKYSTAKETDKEGESVLYHKPSHHHVT